MLIRFKMKEFIHEFEMQKYHQQQDLPKSVETVVTYIVCFISAFTFKGRELVNTHTTENK